MTVMQRILFVFIVVVGLMAITSIMFLRPSAVVVAAPGKDTFANKQDDDADKPDLCPDNVLDAATKQAFRTKLSRDPTNEELIDFRKQLQGLRVSSATCNSIATKLASEYINRGLPIAERTHSDAAPVTTDAPSPKPIEREMCTINDMIDAINVTFKEKLDRSPRKREVDRYVERLKELELSADECRATAKALMSVYIDREYHNEDDDVSKTVPSIERPTHDDESSSKAIDIVHEPQHYEDVLYQGLAITQPNCINDDKQHKDIETKLAKFMRERNRTFLQNLCKHTDRTAELEKKAVHCALTSSGCSDGTPLMKHQSVGGTNLKEATEMTSVGSVMPRFVYAEYV